MRTVAALSFEQTALVLAWAAIVLLAFAVSGLLRQVHALAEALQGRGRGPAGPPTGTVAPAIPELDGADRSLLLFADADCPACEQALERLAGFDTRGTGVARAVLYRGDAPERHTGVTTIPHAGDVFGALGVTVTPSAVALDEHRRVIASGPVGSPELVEQFLAYLTRGREAP
ncbi:MAG TPA: hypothetical protein VKG45_14550 [Actinomycetes bacterium]|nr:hypothetical protein [Actinomycetes bacterium]